MIEMKSTNGYTFYISECDYEKVSKYKWYLDKEANKGGYIRRTDKGNIQLHRFLLEATEGEVVDHIDHNIFNNTKENLRKCTQAQNVRNRIKDPVKFDGHKGWGYKIMSDGKIFCSPQYSTEEEAKIMYNRKAKELHGEFAFLYDVIDDGRKILSNKEKTRKSKYKGVSYCKATNKWRVIYKKTSFGYFIDEKEAFEFSKWVRKIW